MSSLTLCDPGLPAALPEQLGEEQYSAEQPVSQLLATKACETFAGVLLTSACSLCLGLKIKFLSQRKNISRLGDVGSLAPPWTALVLYATTLFYLLTFSELPNPPCFVMVLLWGLLGRCLHS